MNANDWIVLMIDVLWFINNISLQMAVHKCTVYSNLFKNKQSFTWPLQIIMDGFSNNKSIYITIINNSYSMNVPIHLSAWNIDTDHDAEHQTSNDV